MAVRNTSGLDSRMVRKIVRFCAPKNLDMKPLRIWVKRSRYSYAGRYYGYRMAPKVIARLGNKFPMKLGLYQYAQHKGKRYHLANREEALVYIMAHELRHAWQDRGRLQNSSFPGG